jgi:hypothetical protein
MALMITIKDYITESLPSGCSTLLKKVRKFMIMSSSLEAVVIYDLNTIIQVK